MRINHNISAMNTYRQLGNANSAQAKSMEKLSSGMKINRSADDAAGLAISEKMRNQVRGLDQASRNAQDGISLIQTAEGALNETHSMLQRMAELTAQAANETLTTDDSDKIQAELVELSSQIDKVATQTKFNTKNLLDGTNASLTFQVGANADETITLNLTDNKAATLNVDISATGLAALDGTNATAKANLTKIQDAINTVSENRSNLGAVQNRLEHTINNLGTTSENLTAAESRIRDTDMAKTMMEQTKNSILAQASQSMLAQANQSPQGVLQLLR
ncbi:flagellin [Bacillus sp. F19]|nr:flagellin [Bacillus sp. F19]